MDTPSRAAPFKRYPGKKPDAASQQKQSVANKTKRCPLIIILLSCARYTRVSFIYYKKYV